MKLGDKVYIEDHNLFGTIQEIQGDRITKVAVNLPDGVSIIDTINMVVLIVKGVSSVIQLATVIWNKIKERKRKIKS